MVKLNGKAVFIRECKCDPLNVIRFFLYTVDPPIQWGTAEISTSSYVMVVTFNFTSAEAGIFPADYVGLQLGNMLVASRVETLDPIKVLDVYGYKVKPLNKK